MRKFFTSESVTEGHPDKICDQVSDAILDAMLAQDPQSRVACETVAGKGQILVTGEITSSANVDIEQIVRNTVREIGFDNAETDIFCLSAGSSDSKLYSTPPRGNIFLL